MAQDPLKIATQGMPGPAVNQQGTPPQASPVQNRMPKQRFTGQAQGIPLSGLEGTSNIGGKPRVPAGGMARFAPAQPPGTRSDGDRQVPQGLVLRAGLPDNVQTGGSGRVADFLFPARHLQKTLGEQHDLGWRDRSDQIPASGQSGAGGLPSAEDLNQAINNQRLISRADENDLMATMGADGRVTIGGERPADSTGPGEQTLRYGDTKITEYVGANGERAFTNLPQGQRDSFVPNAGSGAIAPDRGLINAYQTAERTYRSMMPQRRSGGGGLPDMQRQLAQKVADIDKNSSIGEIRAAQAAGTLLKQLQGNAVNQQNAQTSRMQVMADMQPQGMTPYQRAQLQQSQQELAYQQRQDQISRAMELGKIQGVEKRKNMDGTETMYIRTMQGIYPEDVWFAQQAEAEYQAALQAQGGN